MLGYSVKRWGVDPEWGEITDPRPGPGDVLVEVEACGIGLTVLNCINGDLASDPKLLPRVPGHEFVGRVLAVGSEVDHGLMGQRVMAYFYLFCDECWACRHGREPQCENLAGWIGVNRDGGYAPRAVVPARNVIVVPETIDALSATVVADAVATPVHVGHRANIGAGDRVVVTGGGGGVGIHMVQVALNRGAVVAGFDVVDAKLEKIESFGARAVRSNIWDEVDPGVFEGRRPTVVVDLMGTAESTNWAIRSLDMGGRLVALTTFRGPRAEFESRDLVTRELSILGSRYATRRDVVEAGELVATGAVQPVIGAVVGPRDALGVHNLLRNGLLMGRGALDWRTI